MLTFRWLWRVMVSSGKKGLKGLKSHGKPITKLP